MIFIKELIEKLNNKTAQIVGGGSIIKDGKRIWKVIIEEKIILTHIQGNDGYVDIPKEALK